MILKPDEAPGTRERRSAARGARRRAGDGPLVLVAIPPTGPAGHLVDLGRAIARPEAGRLLLATVVPLPRITPYAAADSLLAARGARLARIRRELDGRVPVCHVVVVAHGVGPGIIELARQRRADLVLVGWPRRGAEDGGKKGPGRAVRELLGRAPCGVCVTERSPAPDSRLVLVSTNPGPETELGISVGRAMICRSFQARGGGGDHRTREDPGDTSAGVEAGVAPGPASGSLLERIAVAGSLHRTRDRSLAERALALGADALVANAVVELGSWPLRRRVVRTGLADSFPGPVALVHCADPELGRRGSEDAPG